MFTHPVLGSRSLEDAETPQPKRSRLTSWQPVVQVWQRGEKEIKALEAYKTVFGEDPLVQKYFGKSFQSFGMGFAILKKAQEVYRGMDPSLRMRMAYGCTHLLVSSDQLNLKHLQLYLEFFKQDEGQQLDEVSLHWFVGFLANPEGDEESSQVMVQLVLDLITLAAKGQTPSKKAPTHAIAHILNLLEEALLASGEREESVYFMKSILKVLQPHLPEIFQHINSKKTLSAALASLLSQNPNPAYFAAAVVMQGFQWRNCTLSSNQFCALLGQCDLNALWEISYDGCLKAIKARRHFKKKEEAGLLLTGELEFVKRWLATSVEKETAFPYSLGSIIEFRNVKEIWPFLESHVAFALLCVDREVFRFLFALLQAHPLLVLAREYQDVLKKAFKQSFQQVCSTHLLDIIAVCLHHLPREEFIGLMEEHSWCGAYHAIYPFFPNAKPNSFQRWLNGALSDQLESASFEDSEEYWPSFYILNRLIGDQYYALAPLSHDQRIALFANLLEDPTNVGIKTRQDYMRVRKAVQQMTVTFFLLLQECPLEHLKELMENLVTDCINLGCSQEALLMLIKFARKGPLPQLQDADGHFLIEDLLRERQQSLEVLKK